MACEPSVAATGGMTQRPTKGGTLDDGDFEVKPDIASAA
jgi:hypothetical protein